MAKELSIGERLEKQLLENLARRRAAEKKPATVTVCSEKELSLETRRERLKSQAERVFEAEKEEYRLAQEMHRASGGMTVVVDNNPISGPVRDEKGEVDWERTLKAHRSYVEGWVKAQRDAARYERYWRSQTDYHPLQRYDRQVKDEIGE